MRKLLLTAAAILVTTSAGALAAPTASKQLGATYCATVTNDGQTTTCDFQSLQQCQAFVSGQSGTCGLNSMNWTESQARYVLPYGVPFIVERQALPIDEEYNSQRP